MLKKLIRILIIPGLFVLIYFLYKLGLPIPCVFHKITGLYCPGCGITRCLISLIQLDFYQAFRYNQLIFMLSPFLLPYILYLYITFVLELDDNITKKIPHCFWYILLVIVICFGILRNIPYFNYLAPTFIK